MASNRIEEIYSLLIMYSDGSTQEIYHRDRSVLEEILEEYKTTTNNFIEINGMWGVERSSMTLVCRIESVISMRIIQY